jgi:hypothetical protein
MYLHIYGSLCEVLADNGKSHPTRATFPTHLDLLALTIRTMLGDIHVSLSSDFFLQKCGVKCLPCLLRIWL